MRSLASRRVIHAHVRPRQNIVPVGPAAMPQLGPDTSFSLYLTTGGAVMTMAAQPTATALVMDTTVVETPAFPSTLPRAAHSAPSSFSSSSVAKTATDVTAAAATASALTTTTALTAAAAAAAATSELDPAQIVYQGTTNTALHALPPAIFGIAIGGTGLIVFLALYCFICRWYYRRLPRSTKRWDVDDQRKKEPLYGDKPHYSPSEDKAPQLVDDRRGVDVGDSYFPQGETWRKFEGRTARHPESFIYTGTQLRDEPVRPSLDSTGAVRPYSNTALPRPRPRFVQTRHGQTDSVFSNVSFPTTHRADSIYSDFYPDGDNDGEIWDPASPSFVAGDARFSMVSTTQSSATNRQSIFRSAANRGSIFGDACARGSIVVYDSQLAHPSNIEGSFAGSTERGNASVMISSEHFASKKGDDPGKRSLDIGKKSLDGHHGRSRSRDVRALGTLVEDRDESTEGHGEKMPSRNPLSRGRD